MYIKEFGFFFFLRMAVAVSSTWREQSADDLGKYWLKLFELTSFFSAPEASLSQHQY